MGLECAKGGGVMRYWSAKGWFREMLGRIRARAC